MLRNRNIAFFIDVDNVGLSSENYDNILAQLEGMGTILMGKVYGAKERKHKSIYQSAEVKGYKVERPMRIKRRGRKDFDSRIFIDVVDAVCKAPAIDAVCVITASCDLVYLYSYLHGKGIKIISSEENEQASAEMVDEIVDLGRVYEIVLAPSKPRTAKPKTVAKRVAAKKIVKPVRETVVEQVVEQDDNTDELLKEIERLRSITESQQAEREAHSKSLEEAKKKAEAEKAAHEKAIAEARQKAYEDAKREAEKEVLAKIKAEEDAKKKAEAEKAARDKAIEEARQKAYEEARKEAEKEAIAKEEEARKKAEAEAKRRAEEIEKIRAERVALEEKEARAEQELKVREEQAARAREKAIEEARQKAYEEARKEAEKEAIAKVKAEEEARKKALEEAKAREAELKRQIAELEARRVEEQNAKNDENADELLREIEKLKRLTSETHQLVKEIKEEGATPRETIVEKIIYQPAHTASTASAVAAEPVEPEPVAVEPESDEDDDDEYAERRIVETTTEVKTTTTPAEPTTRVEIQVPITDENGETTYSAPRAYYIPQNDSTLIRKIEEIRKNSDDTDSEELLEEIRRLLEGLD